VSGTENTFGQRTLVWVDRKGNEEPLSAPLHAYFNPRISRDGTRVALGIETAGKRDIWVWNLVHKTLERLTFEGNDNAAPLWTPDDKRIAFNLVETGIYWKAADGGGKEELLVSGPSITSCPFSWANNGKSMIVMNWSNGYDIAMLPMEGDRKYRSLLNRNYNEAQPQISPDGRWMAYMSNESGQNQIYVRPFPEVESGRWQISMSGGDSPLWSPDGQELFYRSGDAAITAAVKTESAFSLGTSRTLFQGAYVRSVLMMGNYDFVTWHIHPDGKRFLMMKEMGSGASGGGGPRRINIVLNWTEELKQRMPGK
jgi:Tol biopolymer transport system component